MNNLPSRFRSQRGVALVISLSVMAVVLLMVVGFLVSMRVEQLTARTYSGQLVARQMAEAWA